MMLLHVGYVKEEILKSTLEYNLNPSLDHFTNIVPVTNNDNDYFSRCLFNK